MPTYQYECGECEYAFEAMQSIKDAKLKECPKCKKASLHRLIGSGGGIVFKGTGFYETDYKKSGVSKSACPAGGDTSKCSNDCGFKK